MKINTKIKSISAIIIMALLISSSYGQTENEDQYKQILSKYKTDIPTKILTPDVVETRIGTLEFYDGMPMQETPDKVYDNLDFMRGVDVFLNFIPATSIEGLRQGMKELGVDDYNKVMVMDNLMDAPGYTAGLSEADE